MNIKYQALEQQLKKKLHAVYLLTGQDHYLLNDAAQCIKTAWRGQHACDEKKIWLNTKADWMSLFDEANSYSMFSETVLIDASLDKKSMDAAEKKMLQHYMQHINPRCLVLIRAPHVPNKQLQLLTNNEHTLLVQAYPFSAQELQRWITLALSRHNLEYTKEIPALIHQFTQGNMLACAQVIEKLTLVASGKPLTQEIVREQLSDQCDYQLYELADACLASNVEKALHLLRLARQNRTEPTLILWLLSQEIRQLTQLCHLRNQSIPLALACAQLNIWPQRARSYELALKRLSLVSLYELLQRCQHIDNQIKSNQNAMIWHEIERVALSLS